MAEAMINFVIFGTNGIVKRVMQSGDPNVRLNVFQNIISGSISGGVGSLLITPSEMVKIRLQIQMNKKNESKYKSAIDCLIQVYREEGRTGIFYGLKATMYREVPSFGIYFGSYELFRKLVEKK